MDARRGLFDEFAIAMAVLTRLPVGIQLAGAPFAEANLIQLAVDLQSHFPHHEESPSFA